MRRRKISSLKTQVGYLICVVALGIILACGYSVITVIHANQAKYDAWCEESCLKLKKAIWKNTIKYAVSCQPVNIMKICREF